MNSTHDTTHDPDRAAAAAPERTLREIVQILYNLAAVGDLLAASTCQQEDVNLSGGTLLQLGSMIDSEAKRAVDLLEVMECNRSRQPESARDGTAQVDGSTEHGYRPRLTPEETQTLHELRAVAQALENEIGDLQTPDAEQLDVQVGLASAITAMSKRLVQAL